MRGALLVIFLLAACAPRLEEKAGSPHRLAHDSASYILCSGYGCPVKQRVALTPIEWRGIRLAMMPPAADATQERANLRRAIARFEILSGAKTGTSADVGETFPASAAPEQMDCLDEATNTATYLQLLQEAGWLRFHIPAGRARRGHLIDAWPHTSAVIREHQSGQLWVVDSWFLDNGEPPFILPVETWRKRWHPPR